MKTLSERQRRILALDTPQNRYMEGQEIAKLLSSRLTRNNSGGLRTVSEGPFWRISVNDDGRRKPKPLAPAIAARVQKLNEQVKLQEKRDLNNRVRRLLTAREPKVSRRQPARGLNAEITRRVAAEPKRWHEFLNRMYAQFGILNGLYFNRELALPIIRVCDLGNDHQAECGICDDPVEIRFAVDTVEDNDDDPRYLEDILCHEVCHAAIALMESPAAAWCEKTLGHHDKFASICNIIARRRGWKPIAAGSQEACYWPEESKPFA